MTIDKNEFFRQATKRICGKLEIETAIGGFLEYLNTIIPVAGAILLFYERDPVVFRIVAHVTGYEIKKLNQVIRLSRKIRKTVERDWAAIKMREVVIFNRPEEHPVSQMMTNLMGIPDCSVMVLRLVTEDNRMCGFVTYAVGKDRYNQEHAELISLLHDPFAIAMSNAIKHEEVIKLKDMLADDVQYLHKELLKISGTEIVGKNTGLKGVMQMVSQVAPLNSPVLLMGETGVGKEVIANAIHYASPRKNGPFIKVNCGAIPDSLIDSELFGHEKGAFTGAVYQKRGRFERAQNGTILLDEIGELPLQAQVRLLRVLQSKEIERVGGSTSVPVDVRIISATHGNLEEMVRSGQFREDLWYRLNVFPIMIPPLRQRKEDIPSLLNYFIKRKSKELMVHNVPEAAPGATDVLMSYSWPGNVRELENVVERALIQNRGIDGSGLLTFGSFNSSPKVDALKFSLGNKTEYPKLDEAMSVYIKRILDVTNGKIDGRGGAAELLGIHPNTLRSRMKKLGIVYKNARQ